MNGPASDSNSDDTDEDVEAEEEEEDVYRRKYQLLLERCEVLQQDNERLVHRAQEVKKLARRIRRERKMLMERLDSHGDNWRNTPITFEREEILTQQLPLKREKSSGSNVAAKSSAGKIQSTGEKGRRGGNSNATGAPNSGSTSKRKSAKGDRPEKDPNAPKRPANPFLQFCQEQRPLAVSAAGLERASGNSEGGETSKQEITRQLASKWNTLAPEDKKIYYDMYESAKEKYAEEMKLYSANNRASDDNPS